MKLWAAKKFQQKFIYLHILVIVTVSFSILILKLHPNIFLGFMMTSNFFPFPVSISIVMLFPRFPGELNELMQATFPLRFLPMAHTNRAFWLNSYYSTIFHLLRWLITITNSLPRTKETMRWMRLRFFGFINGNGSIMSSSISSCSRLFCIFIQASFSIEEHRRDPLFIFLHSLSFEKPLSPKGDSTSAWSPPPLPKLSTVMWWKSFKWY